MSIRYTLRRLKEGDCTTDNLKDYELAVSTTNGRIVFRLGDTIYDLTGEAGTGTIEASRLWAVSEDSPDGTNDTESPTGKTMSSRSWALVMSERANNALTTAESTLTAAQTAAANATATAQQINSTIATIDQRLTQAESNLSQSTTLLNRLIDITDADEVRY